MSEKNVIQIPDKEDLQKRLRDGQLGELFADDLHGANIKDGTTDVWFSVPVGKADQLLVGDMVVIYDFHRGMWLGGRITGMDVRRAGTSDRDMQVYDKQEVPLIDRLIKKHMYPALASQLFKVEPLAAFKEETRTIPNFVPCAASILLLPVTENTWKEPTIYEILDLPPKGIILGIFSQNQRLYKSQEGAFVKYKLNIDDLVNRHMVILGSTGMGKTIFLKKLAWGLADSGRAVITFDLQGDIVQMAEAGTEPKKLEDKEIWKDLEWNAESFNKDKFKILAPVLGTPEEYDKTELELIEKYTSEMEVDFEKYCLQFKNVRTGEQLVMYMPYLTDRARDGLMRLFDLFRKLRIEHFIQTIENKKTTTRGGYIKWVENGEEVTMHAMSYENMMGQLRSLANLKVFDVPGYKEPEIENFVKEGQITVFYLSHLGGYLRARYELHIPYVILSKRQIVPKTSIIIDEAHEVVPRRAGTTGYATLVSDIFANVARQGRKYDIDLITSTHKPKDLNTIVYDLAGTMISFRLSEEDAKVAGIPHEFRLRVTAFDPGYALINSPENSRVPWIEIKVPWARCAHEKPKSFFERLRQLQS